MTLDAVTPVAGSNGHGAAADGDFGGTVHPLAGRTGQARAPQAVEPDQGSERPACATPWIAVVDARPCRREFVLNFLQRQAMLVERVLALSMEEMVSAHGDAPGRPALIVFSIGGLSITDPSVGRDFERLLETFVGVPLVVLSDRDERDEVRFALAAGARGFVSTLLDPQLMCAALSLVRVGGRFAPPDLFDKWMSGRDDFGTESADDELSDEPPPQSMDLTPRQTHVLQLLQEGFPNKVIAARLGMTESTVKVHVRQIMRRLGAKNRTEAALLAQRVAPIRKTAC